MFMTVQCDKYFLGFPNSEQLVFLCADFARLDNSQEILITLGLKQSFLVPYCYLLDQ